MRDALYRKTKCKSPQFSSTVLEGMVWAFAQQLLLDPISIERSLNRIPQSVSTAHSASLQHELVELKRRQAEADRERGNYRQMLGRERMTEAEFDLERHRLDKEWD